MYLTAGSSNGRTPAFEAENPGSSPGPAIFYISRELANGTYYETARKFEG